MSDLSTGFSIGDYNVFPLQGRITGTDSDAHVQPKIIDVLICLASAAGEVVSREQMHNQVWGNVIVTDDALNRCISELRRVFGGKGNAAHYIETVPKRGYRLVAAVKQTSGHHEATPQHVASVPPDINTAISTVAVIPFQNQTPDSPHAFLAEAIPSSLHSSLARLNRIRVSSRRTSFALANSGMRADELGRELGAQYIVSGSIAGAGDSVRIIVEVDDADAGVLLWSQRYEVDGSDLLSFEQQLTEAIIGAFGGQRLRAEISHAQEAPPSQLDAWGLVQKARAYLVGYNTDSLLEARELLKEAVDKDPDYAFAQAMYGLLLAENVINGISETQTKDITLAKAAIDKALKLAPGDPAVLRTCGCAQAYCGDYTHSIATLRRTLVAAPFDFGAWGYLGWPLTATGETKDLRETLQICDRLLANAPSHPGAPFWQYHQSVAQLCLNESEQAKITIENCLATQPQFAPGLVHYANILGQLNMVDEALATFEQATDANPHLSAQSYRQIIELLSDRDEVRELRLAGLRQAGLLPA